MITTTICLLKSWLLVCILSQFFPLPLVELILHCAFPSHAVLSVFAFLSPFPFLPLLTLSYLLCPCRLVEWGVGVKLLPSIQPCLCCWGEKPGFTGEDVRAGSVVGAVLRREAGKRSLVTEAWRVRPPRFRFSHYIIHLTSSSRLEVPLPEITL